MKKTYFLIVLVLLLAGCGRKAVITDFNIVPEPVFMVQKEGVFTLHGSPKVSMVNLGQNSPIAKYIMKSMRHGHLHPSLVSAAEKSDIEIVVNDTANPEIGDEGYVLEVRSDGIRLSANTEHGVFYAYQTLVQLLPPDITQTNYSSITLPECTILDYPRFAWRGAHLDVCRHFFPAKFVKKYIDVMANYKLNKLHFHLTDDHGWRLPSERYPKLNSVGSWRVDRDDQPWGQATPPQPDEKATYGGFYTREEIADLVDYAAARGIEIIPEIEIPGHCCAILAAYPKLSCDGGPYEVQIGPYWPPKAILCAGNDSTLVFLKAVLDEVVEMFPSQYIHIGGDEAVKDMWKGCLFCQRRIRAEKNGASAAVLVRRSENLRAYAGSRELSVPQVQRGADGAIADRRDGARRRLRRAVKPDQPRLLVGGCPQRAVGGFDLRDGALRAACRVDPQRRSALPGGKTAQ